MISQILVRVLGSIFTFVALPALAVIGIAYYRKDKSKGSMLFAGGSVATTIGSMFNRVIPFRFFLDQSKHTLSDLGRSLTLTALIIHIIGFTVMVLGLGIITFQNKK